jgi:hypothetical protein
MTSFDFMVLCGQLDIHPALALENDELREALRARDDAKVREILETQF